MSKSIRHHGLKRSMDELPESALVSLNYCLRVYLSTGRVEGKVRSEPIKFRIA